MKNHIVDGDHLAAMMDAPGFMEVTEYPHDFSPRLFLERGSFARWGTRTSAPRSSLTIGAVTSWHSHQLDDSRRCAWRFSEHDPEVVFIRVGDDWLGAYHVETGTHLATASR